MMKSLQRVLLVGVLLALSVSAGATVLLRKDHPEVYYVKKGDTLWDISGRFLQHPWQWPQIWQNNPDINNPHLIYPGDAIRLSWVNGKPRLTVEHSDTVARSRLPDGTVKLTPRVRALSEKDAIPSIPMSDIQAYLKDGLVVTRKQIKDAPYVVGGQDRRVEFGMGDTIYARDPLHRFADMQKRYGLYRTGEEYVDPDTGEVLGYEARKVGTGRVLSKERDMVTMEVVRSSEDVRVDDRLFTQPDREVRAVLYPHPPKKKSSGNIIRFFDRINSVATHDVVVIDRGKRDGMDEGTVLDIYQQGEKVRDREDQEMIRLPRMKVGSMILFRVFDKVSYGLIMDSTRPIYMKDEVVSPEGSY